MSKGMWNLWTDYFNLLTDREELQIIFHSIQIRVTKSYEISERQIHYVRIFFCPSLVLISKDGAGKENFNSQIEWAKK